MGRVSLRKKVRTKDYAKQLSAEFGINQRMVQAILSSGWKSIMIMMRNKESIEIPGFGRIELKKITTKKKTRTP